MYLNFRTYYYWILHSFKYLFIITFICVVHNFTSNHKVTEYKNKQDMDICCIYT